MSKEIWLPTSTMNVRVQDGAVTVWEDMEMERKPIVIKKPTGFGEKKDKDA